mgnify:FL=1
MIVTTSCVDLSLANTSTDTLNTYWPITAQQQRCWELVDHANRTRPMMTVTHTQLNNTSFRMWFSGKPGQSPDQFSIEQFRYCKNTGGISWLWLDKYIDFDRATGSWIEHSIQSTKILFTPAGSPTHDLLADGTYARCGKQGQPYLLFNQPRQTYRIQVWGTIDRDKYPRSNWQWYWDATVSVAEDICNDCLVPQKCVKAIKVKEAWWCNFPGASGWSGQGGGTLDTNGLPTGEHVIPFRTVWHAEGQLPYYMIGTASEKPNWCTRAIWKITQKPSTPKHVEYAP